MGKSSRCRRELDKVARELKKPESARRKVKKEADRAICHSKRQELLMCSAKRADRSRLNA